MKYREEKFILLLKINTRTEYFAYFFSFKITLGIYKQKKKIYMRALSTREVVVPTYNVIIKYVCDSETFTINITLRALKYRRMSTTSSYNPEAREPMSKPINM